MWVGRKGNKIYWWFRNGWKERDGGNLSFLINISLGAQISYTICRSQCKTEVRDPKWKCGNPFSTSIGIWSQGEQRLSPLLSVGPYGQHRSQASGANPGWAWTHTFSTFRPRFFWPETRGSQNLQHTVFWGYLWALRSQKVQNSSEVWVGGAQGRWPRFYPPLCHLLVSNWPWSSLQSLIASISASVSRDIIRALMGGQAQSWQCNCYCRPRITLFLLSTEARWTAVCWCWVAWTKPTTRDSSTGYHCPEWVTGV